MNIRKEQIITFEEVAAKQFEKDAALHASEFAPKHVKVLGEEGTRAVVRLGIRRASRYGFSATGSVHFFLDLMFLLGSEFDTDPQYPWAGEILNDESIPGQMPRADKLYSRAIQYLDAVAGPDNQFAIAAFRRLKSLVAGSLADGCSESAGRVVEKLNSIHPEKAAYLGQAGLQALVSRSSERALARGISNPQAALLFAVLEFGLGHAFEHDLLYPWIEATLSDTKVASRDDLVLRLHRKAATYLDHVVVYLDQKQDG
jgi:hypothetical protein